MNLNDDERAMRDGRDGPAVAKAMDLLCRYGEALGAERLVNVRNVAGTLGAATPFMREFALKHGGMDAVFSEFNLDSDEVVEVPPFKVYTTHLQQGLDPERPAEFNVPEEIIQIYRKGERYAAERGMQMVNTCTPYLVGNVPVKGEHLAWIVDPFSGDRTEVLAPAAGVVIGRLLLPVVNEGDALIHLALTEATARVAEVIDRFGEAIATELTLDDMPTAPETVE